MVNFMVAKFAETMLTLVAWYEPLARAEWIDPIVLGVLVVVCLIPGIVLLRLGWYDDNEVHSILGAIFTSAAFICLIAGVIELTQAYKATAAPKAYAVEMLMKHLDGK